MAKVILRCGGQTCCPEISLGDCNLYIIKDDYGGKIYLNKKQLKQIPEKIKELDKLIKKENKNKSCPEIEQEKLVKSLKPFFKKPTN